MLIIFALLIMPVSLAIGVVAVDASMWQSERRGAQKDADLAALAGAYELLKPIPVAADAEAQARQNADLNDEAGNASVIEPIVIDDSCFSGTGRLDSVKLNIDHDSHTFFANAFGLSIAPDIGAHARACAGSIVSRKGLRPYGIESSPAGATSCPAAFVDPALIPSSVKFVSYPAAPNPVQPTHTPRPTDTPVPPTNTRTATTTATPTRTPTPGGPTATPTATATGAAGCDATDCFQYNATLGYNVPKFGSTCQLDDGSADASTSTRGLLDLNLTGNGCSTGGRDDIVKNVLNGSGATCSVGDTVIRTAGARPGQDTSAIQDLLAGNGTPAVVDGSDCDVKFSVPSPGTDHAGIDDFEEVVERIDGGPPGPSPDAVYQLRACVSPRVIDLIVIGNFATDPTIKAFAAFYILGCKVDTDSRPLTSILPNKCATGAPGHLQLWGIFLQKLDLHGDTGEFNEFGDHSITLTE